MKKTSLLFPILRQNNSNNNNKVTMLFNILSSSAFLSRIVIFTEEKSNNKDQKNFLISYRLKLEGAIFHFDMRFEMVEVLTYVKPG